LDRIRIEKKTNVLNGIYKRLCVAPLKLLGCMPGILGVKNMGEKHPYLRLAIFESFVKFSGRRSSVVVW
jgi:hypothetical protein